MATQSRQPLSPGYPWLTGDAVFGNDWFLEMNFGPASCQVSEMLVLG